LADILATPTHRPAERDKGLRLVWSEFCYSLSLQVNWKDQVVAERLLTPIHVVKPSYISDDP